MIKEQKVGMIVYNSILELTLTYENFLQNILLRIGLVERFKG
jgi:hypothetical protein